MVIDVTLNACAQTVRLVGGETSSAAERSGRRRWCWGYTMRLCDTR